MRRLLKTVLFDSFLIAQSAQHREPLSIARLGQMLTAGTFLVTGLLSAPTSQAQVSVGADGTPTYSQAIAVPPGVGGLAPSLSLAYASGGVNGAEGYGWNLSGTSSISRCPATIATDGVASGVAFAPTDKLCLDGQRLIQTDESGNPAAATNAQGLPVATQVNDAQGLPSGSYREFRTEKDTYARVRAYGYADGSTAASGPAFFRVWTKAGQIYDYGASANADANTKALVTPEGSTTGMVWAVARISDTLGNYIDFKYEQRDTPFGTLPQGQACSSSCSSNGREWNLLEIQYSGNKVIFNYSDRPSRVPEDRAEAYQSGSKNVSVRRLDTIVTYVNSPNTSGLGPAGTAVAVMSVKLAYDNGPISGRSRLTSITQCAGLPTSTNCLPPTVMSYASGGNDAFVSSQAFTNSSLATTQLVSTAGSYGLLTGDFNGDGKTDFILWSNDPTQNTLFLSNGDGTFKQVPNGSGPGQFNLATIDMNLFKRATATGPADSCYSSTALDFNGDGRTDILRWASGTTGAYGDTCPGAQTYLLISNGDGSFTPKTLVDETGAAISIGRATPNMVSACVGGYTSCATSGANFYIGDFNGDGIPDIIATGFNYVGVPLGPPSLYCLSAPGSCGTSIYLGKGDGTFKAAQVLETSTLYLFAPPSADYTRVMDFNGDGRADLELQSPVQSGGLYNGAVYMSNVDAQGHVSFTQGGMLPACQTGWNAATARTEMFDFNGDGRADYICVNNSVSLNTLYVSLGSNTTDWLAQITPTTISGRVALNGAGQDLTASSAVPGATFTSADFNGDGRTDILRVANNPAQNVLYLSNGDGSFTPSSTLSFDGGTAALTNSDGSVDFATGDFTGHGNVEILRMQTTNGVTTNRLYVKTDPTPPDLLVSVKNGNGSATTLYYVSLNNSVPSNGVSQSLGARYISDLGTGNASSYPTQDLAPPNYVVATSVADNGLGQPGSAASQIATEYAYKGFKTDALGRGPLGFRETLQQSLSPSGAPLTTDMQYLQGFPYTSMLASSNVYFGALNATGSSQALHQTTSIYCELSTVTGADSSTDTAATSASVTAPCITTAKIQRPFLVGSTEIRSDLGGNALSNVQTSNFYDPLGNPLTITVTTMGTTAGIAQQFSKSTSSTYYPDNTSCTDTLTCYWILSRLKQATVTNTVPDSLASISTVAGTAANATATRGTGTPPPPPPPVMAAVMAAINLLLLDDDN